MEAFIRAIFPPLANLEMLQDGSSLVPGTDAAIFDEGLGKIGALVCFDTIYESLARDSVASGAELIAIGTNDSWFFDSAAVHMHNRQAMLRAIENRRFVLRAANTGVSSIISPTGEELAHIDPLIEGYAVAEVSFVSTRTLYSYIGDSFVLICQVAILAPFAYDLILYLKKKKAE
jgi:apolipoprotein N-acyltransferase